ncbi:MAG: hypothetical protein JWN40_3808 [Phycisphaerales bacterium]|nr:hypothetical protein [Phycisphaerales bacterium]
MITKASRGLCCVDGRYRRTIGKFRNAQGKVAPRKFLLGTDAKAAQLANIRLEQLWADVVRLTAATNEWNLQQYEQPPYYPADQPPVDAEPLWTPESLEIAEAIRTGQPQYAVPTTAADLSDPDYVRRIQWLRERYPSVAFVPADPETFASGQKTYREVAHRSAAHAVAAAAIANIPIPAGVSQTLYQAIDAYADQVKATKLRDGQVTAWGEVLCKQAIRLKQSHPDTTLDRFDLAAIEKIKHYWAARPMSRYGKPIALDTVRAQIAALKLFAKWLHRHPQWQWRRPEDFEEAIKLDLSELMSHEEVAKLRHGVATYAVPELAIIWKYATARERVLVALALNCGFARTEISSLRLDEIDLAGNPPRIHRIRRKSKVYGQWQLWDVTQRALAWNATERSKVEPAGNVWAILTDRGRPFEDHRIANIWNRLLDRVAADHADFRQLSFKHLRKTGAQFVRNMADGETAAVFLAHGQPVKGDNLSGIYSNPVFARLDAALVKVRELLEPVFGQTPDGFDSPRAKGSPNIKCSQIEQIADLHRAGVHPDTIAAKVGVSRATAYRRISELKAVK